MSDTGAIEMNAEAKAQKHNFNTSAGKHNPNVRFDNVQCSMLPHPRSSARPPLQNDNNNFLIFKTMTEKDIDLFKDTMLKERKNLSFEEMKENVDTFIRMVNQFKEENPTHIKCVQRWRKWFAAVGEDLCRKPIPNNEKEILIYHLETFRVEKFTKALSRLQNWLNRMKSNGYMLDKFSQNKIDTTLGNYGYKLQNFIIMSDLDKKEMDDFEKELWQK